MPFPVPTRKFPVFLMDEISLQKGQQISSFKNSPLNGMHVEMGFYTTKLELTGKEGVGMALETSRGPYNLYGMRSNVG
ncbi:hypothetical protein Leryth_020068 [Lithospermum erythrorhizon]|nr:hypothetical protein Leryth_020068 [Lithospermum erythrorhizon]